MTFWSNIKSTFEQQSKLTVLIVLNIAIFLTVNLGIHIAHINLLPYLGLNAIPEEFIYKFWTLFTYMFTHEGLMHVVYNLILLFFSGQIFYSILGEKRLLYVYIMSGLAGGLIFMLLGFLAPEALFGHILIGASAAVMGIVAVVAIYAPNLPVNVFMLIEIPYKYFAIIVFVLSTLIDFSINTGGKISHIGGALFGLFYGYSLKKGNDLFNFSIFKKGNKNLKVVHRSQQTSTKSGQSDEAALNKLLDKISKSGYDSLTKQERDELFRLSNKK